MKIEKLSRRQAFWIAGYAVLLLLLLLIVQLEKVGAFVDSIYMLLRPVIWGLVLSYAINPLFRLYEKRTFYRMRQMGLRRALSLALAYITFLLIIGLVLAILLPQLYQTVSKFLANFEGYVQSAVAKFNQLATALNDKLQSFGINQNIIRPLAPESAGVFSLNYLLMNIDKVMGWAEQFFGSGGSLSVMEIFGTVADVVTDLLFAFFVSLYFLSTKEKRYAQIMKIRRAFFSDRFNAALTKVFSVTNRTFGSFLRGKLIESVLIAVFAYLLFMLFGVPYALLLAVIGGIANIIPFVGPIIGLIPATVIVLLADSTKIIPVILIIFFIQQIDKNLISPKLLFDNSEISSLCVLISITTVGSMFGVIGLVLGVPLFASVIELVSSDIDIRLRKKGLPSNTENHYAPDSMVDPVKDIRSTPDTIIKALERRIVRLQKQKERGIPLSRAARFWMSLYDFCIKHHIFNELSDEILLQFSADESALAAEEETEELIRRMQGTDLLEK